MRRNRIKFSLLIVLLSVISNQISYGQEKEDIGLKFGFGVSLFNLTEYSYEFDYEPTNSIYMTFDLNNKFRIEPTVAFAINENFDQYTIGVGVFKKKKITKFNSLYGIRLALCSNETLAIAPTLGGEYYFIDNFSVGSEVQLKVLLKNNDWTLLTNSSIIFRFYFD